MQFTNIKTKTKVIALALQELINKNKVAELKFYKGKVNLNFDLDSLRKRNTHPDNSSVF
ncbi:MAG: type II toxin-antitoxin system VapB family antitoxin [Methylobacter sp.]|nr:type II toxin-antitoxin system VapB family antitoxin [Methylobacter sp.]